MKKEIEKVNIKEGIKKMNKLKGIKIENYKKGYKATIGNEDYEWLEVKNTSNYFEETIKMINKLREVKMINIDENDIQECLIAGKEGILKDNKRISIKKVSLGFSHKNNENNEDEIFYQIVYLNVDSDIYTFLNIRSSDFYGKSFNKIYLIDKEIDVKYLDNILYGRNKDLEVILEEIFKI